MRRGIPLEIIVVPVESRDIGPDVVGEQPNERVVILQRLIVAAALDCDAVFRARQLILQLQEVLVRTQLRVGLGKGQQVP